MMPWHWFSLTCMAALAIAVAAWARVAWLSRLRRRLAQIDTEVLAIVHLAQDCEEPVAVCLQAIRKLCECLPADGARLWLNPGTWPSEGLDLVFPVSLSPLSQLPISRGQASWVLGARELPACLQGPGAWGLGYTLKSFDSPLGILEVYFTSSRSLRPEEEVFLDRILQLLNLLFARFKAAEARDDAAERFRLMCDYMHDWEYWLGPKSELVFTSSACEQLTGRTAQELYRDPGIIRSIIHPEDLERFAEHERGECSLKQACGCHYINYRIVHTDGSLRWVMHICQPVFSRNGEYRGRRVSTRDLTRQHKTEEALIQSSQLLQDTLDSLDDALVRVDLDSGKILSHNLTAPRTFGTSTEELLGKEVEVLFWERESWLAYWSMASLGEAVEGTRASLDLPMKRWDGSRFEAEITLVLVGSRAAGKGEALLLVRDVTRRKKAEMESLQSQKMASIGQLAAGVAHEINTPVQFIGDNLRFIKDNLPGLIDLARSVGASGQGGEGSCKDLALQAEGLDLDFLGLELPSAVEQSLDGVNRVAAIVKALKEFAHPEAPGQASLLDLNKSLRDMVTITRSEWKHWAEVKLDLDPSLVLVPCLPGEISQVLINLLVNASQALEEQIAKRQGRLGLITLSTHQEPGWAEVRVADDGPGIPESVRNRIFEPFFTTKPVGRGTGQGLALCRATVVDKHRGTLEFETELGKGTTFILRLPLGEANASFEGTEELLGA